jgi:putative permease
MQLPSQRPFYTKLAQVLISLIAIGFLCIAGKEILCPLIFSLLFSILLLPVASFIERRLHLRRGAAAMLSVLLFVGVITGILYLVGSQITDLVSDWPQFKTQLTSSVNDLQHWVSATFHIGTSKQITYVNNATSKMLDSGTNIVGATVLSLSSVLLFLVFLFIDTFFLLLYRRHMFHFLCAVFAPQYKPVVDDVVQQVQSILRQYIIGLLVEMTIVSSVCCIVYSIAGIKYAILLGIITGLFNIIPYVGIFTALGIGALITFATSGGTPGHVWVVVITTVAMHLIDSNVILPMVVGSKVKINALITVLGVVAGEMIWGIPGMFLSLPVMAIVKIIFDRVDSLKPWGMLLGDEVKS